MYFLTCHFENDAFRDFAKLLYKRCYILGEEYFKLVAQKVFKIPKHTLIKTRK